MSNKTPEPNKPSDKHNSPATFESTGEQRYQWPPVRDPNLSFKLRSRNPVHAIVTALPFLMLAIGLYIYFKAESQQNQGAPIRAESIELTGTFTGLSATSGRHYLWIDRDGVAKGIRLQPHQLRPLESLVRGDKIQLLAAPRVSASTTYWALQIEQAGTLYIDE